MLDFLGDTLIGMVYTVLIGVAVIGILFVIQMVVESYKKRKAEKLTKEWKAREKNKENLLICYGDMIEKFFEIAERKVSVIDEYGDENWKALPCEIITLFKKMAEHENLSHHIDWQKCLKFLRKEKFIDAMVLLPADLRWLYYELEDDFRNFHENQKSRSVDRKDIDNLSGLEFETYIAKLLKENGFEDVRGTPASRDQGADLIAKKNGKTIIIQAKRYQGVVGNKAVQEVIAAVAFYGGDEGWVVTNSTFTISAKALAQKSKIKLIDGKDLQNIGKFLK